ncbi:MAG TPA: hypothetical protein PKK23_09680 [Nitrospirales bacterium]|nr:hypothetical protein [Nitrospirales bacterium]
MTGLEVFGMLLIILGVVGMTAMLKGKRPSYGSSTPKVEQKQNEKLMSPNRQFSPFKT